METAACPDDELLLAFVEGLLCEQDRNGVLTHLDLCLGCRAIVGAAATHDEQPVRVRRGDTVGRYLIQDRVGSGAMGVVFRAFDPELDRTVAVKLLHPRLLGSRSARARLEKEAQALAQLSHPNVLPVYDFGEFGSHTFIATEFIDGPTLREWCADKTPQEIIDAYLDAGRGLSAAHAKRLIHRDFKPENVLVGSDARPRVADFGLVAEVTDGSTGDEDADPEESIGITRDGGIVGTPRYMAPEQLMGGSALAASDQFAFCASLFEALYGEPPFSGADIMALRVAISKGPRRPPTRRSNRQWLAPLLVGLSECPTRRHESVETLLAALRARTQHSVLARGGLLVASVGILSAGATVDWRASGPCAPPSLVPENAKLDDASTALRRRGEPRLADDVSARLDDYAQAWVEAAVTACNSNQDIEQTEAITQCLDVRWLDAQQASLFVAKSEHPDNTIRTIMHQLAAPAGCLSARPGEYEDVDPKTASRIREGYELLSATKLLRMSGDPAAALVKLESANELLSSTRSASLRARTHLIRGVLLVDLAETTEGIQELETAYEQATEARLDSAAHQAAIRLMLANVEDLEDTEEGTRWDERATSLLNKVSATGRVNYLRERSRIRLHQHRLDEALDAALKARAIGEVAADVSPLAIASIDAMVARISLSQGDLPTARLHYERVLDRYLAIFGEGHPNVGVARLGIAQVAIEEADFEDARWLLDAAEEQLKAVLGPAHHQLTLVFATRASLERHLGNFDLALEHHRHAITLCERDDGTSERRLRSALRDMSLTLERAGDHTAALQTRQRVLVLTEGADGSESYQAALSRNNVGASKLALGDLDGAEADFRESIRLLEKSRGTLSPKSTYPMGGLGEVLLARGQVGAARPWLESAIDVANRHNDATQAAATTFVLARLLWATKEPENVERALTLANEAESILREDASYAREHTELLGWLATL